MFVFIYVSLVGLLPSNELFYLNNQGRLYNVWQLRKKKRKKTSPQVLVHHWNLIIRGFFRNQKYM